MSPRSWRYRTNRRAAAKIIVAVGSEAKNMLGRTPATSNAVRPMKDGVIADFTYTEKMLQYFHNKVHGNRMLKPSPRVLCACLSARPKSSAVRSGIRRRRRCAQRRIVSEPMAAAVRRGIAGA